MNVTCGGEFDHEGKFDPESKSIYDKREWLNNFNDYDYYDYNHFKCVTETLKKYI